jgi:hypothetical protein
VATIGLVLRLTASQLDTNDACVTGHLHPVCAAETVVLNTCATVAINADRYRGIQLQN